MLVCGSFEVSLHEVELDAPVGPHQRAVNTWILRTARRTLVTTIVGSEADRE
jgi:hypothetical protein